ncbi:MAG: hypothetical protein PHG64_14710 [Paludibacter sp.]|nr:hypothetical protein [Paludibacter sp.]
MAKLKIVKLNLESRAQDLKTEGKSLNEIATILSTETKQHISKSNVYRYFESNESVKAIAIEKRESLQSKIIETEVETINRRLKSIDHLWNKIQASEDLHEIAYATKVYNESIDGVAKELGKFPTPGIHIDNSKTENTVNVVLHLPRKDPLPGKV